MAELMPISHNYIGYFTAQVQEKKDMLRIERSKFFPEFSVGYTQQKIYPLNRLNAWTVGVSAPLLFFPQRSRSKQAKVDLRIAEWENESNCKQLENKVEELYRQIAQQRRSLDYFQNAALKEASSLQESALLKFKESETDIATLVQSLNSAREIMRNYIETIYNYNVSILEIELYTD